MTIKDLKLVQLFAAKPYGDIQSDTATIAPSLNPENNDLNRDCENAGMVDSDHSYRAVVIGLALSLGREDGADSVPDCVLRWLSQAALEGCTASDMTIDWLDRKSPSSNRDVCSYSYLRTKRAAARSEPAVDLETNDNGGRYE